MAKTGYSNLSMPTERFEEMRRRFEGLDSKYHSMASFAADVMDSAVSKMEFVMDNLAHINFSGIGKNGIALFDEKTDELLRVHKKGNNLFCSVHKEKPCDHKIFAAMHPEFII